jgi:outer membrane lipoprotein-sorting protein
LFTGLVAGQSPDDINVDSLVREIDQLYRAKSSYAEMSMEIVTPHWSRALDMKGWTEGTEKTFIRILSPAKERGVATLRIESEMWNYLPKTNKVMKVPPSMMMSSWMGSDFTNDDLVKEFTLFEDYEYELTHPDSARDDVYYVKCIPHEGVPVVWGHIVIAARKSDHIPLWQKFYDEKGVLMRVMTYSEVQKMGGRIIPTVTELIPQHKEGHKTIFRYNKAEFDVGIDDEIFSLRSLRSQN